jgi:hypothetical protein
VPPPDAVSVVFTPAQIFTVAGEMEAVGEVFTVMLLDAEAVHPLALVTVTVYVVLETGLSVMVAVVAPVLQT